MENINKNEVSDEISTDDLTPDNLSADEKTFAMEYMALIKAGSLVKQGTVTVRSFKLHTGPNMLAYVFSELPDSFVVGLPVMVTKIKGNINIGKLFTEEPMVRIYKSSIFMTAMPTPSSLLCYFLTTRSNLKHLTGYFNTYRVNQVDSLIEALKEIVNKTTPEKVSQNRKIENQVLQIIQDKLNQSEENPTPKIEIPYDGYGIASKKIKYKH